MKIKRQRLTSQQHAIDARLREWLALRDQPPPRSGWLRAVRESLGLSARQLATRLGVTQRTVQSIEEAEVRRKVTLASLDKAARAMSCRVVYAIVPDPPNSSLDDIVSRQATALARELAGKVEHSMKLEDQAVAAQDSAAQVRELADELKRKLDSRIWNVRS
jgi:predicted DNA-binding mobile mystery protein A